MRYFFVFFCYLIYLAGFELAASEKINPKKHSTICLNMIIKDEKEVICRCLQSVKPLIDYWVIVDTGSTDKTQEIVKEFMKDIPGELHERPWVNFAHNRNEALSLAQNKSDYIFFVDADDVIELKEGFCKRLLDLEGYSIDIRYAEMNYGRTALIKSGLPWKWMGAVHEVLVCDAETRIGELKDVVMKIIGGGDRSADPQKFLKDAKLLEAELQKMPGHGRTQFYLAQSYRDAQKPELALKHYKKRIALRGWDQEVFWSLYQIGQLYEDLNFAEKEIIDGYSTAFLFRPSRLEPLYRLCHYY
ncbi:MAG: glycosyltransferase, partial [Chlamydiales bacterium]|nr:glycosyltransferase [Chlamydiales bacterium]